MAFFQGSTGALPAPSATTLSAGEPVRPGSTLTPTTRSVQLEPSRGGRVGPMWEWIPAAWTVLMGPRGAVALGQVDAGHEWGTAAGEEKVGGKCRFLHALRVPGLAAAAGRCSARSAEAADTISRQRGLQGLFWWRTGRRKGQNTFEGM